jgi:hypothetical protein
VLIIFLLALASMWIFLRKGSNPSARSGGQTAIISLWAKKKKKNYVYRSDFSKVGAQVRNSRGESKP